MLKENTEIGTQLFEEDHADNLRWMTANAHQYCKDCANYHVMTAVSRITGHSGWNIDARPPLTEFVRSQIRRSNDDVVILIVGSADTSILATCAQAAHAERKGDLSSVKFEIIDRCNSPLELCQRYSRHYGLNTTTTPVDVTNDPYVSHADIIVMHSFVEFIERSFHESLFNRCARWLKPEGRLFSWHPVGPADVAQKLSRQREMVTKFRTMMDEGQIVIEEPLDLFDKRLNWLSSTLRGSQFGYDNLEEVLKVAMAGGLEHLYTEGVRRASGRTTHYGLVFGLEKSAPFKI